MEATELRTEVEAMLQSAWHEPGFCVPNPDVYPWQWCWDSWFHAVIWVGLDGQRAIAELGIVSNPAFEVSAASFNALVPFNLREFAAVDPGGPWARRAGDLAAALSDRWDGSTWVDGAHPRADAPTLEALLGVLVDPRDQVWAALTDEHSFAGRYGTWQTSRAHPGVDPDGCWRWASWAPLEYLFWVAARRQGRDDIAVELAGRFVRGAVASGLAEYWNPTTGAPHGARPQTWTGLALPVYEWLEPRREQP